MAKRASWHWCTIKLEWRVRLLIDCMRRGGVYIRYRVLVLVPRWIASQDTWSRKERDAMRIVRQTHLWFDVPFCSSYWYHLLSFSPLLLVLYPRQVLVSSWTWSTVSLYSNAVDCVRDTYIFPTPLYTFTSPLIPLSSSMVNWSIFRSRSFACWVDFVTASCLCDWTAVCWICTRICDCNCTVNQLSLQQCIKTLTRLKVSSGKADISSEGVSKGGR